MKKINIKKVLIISIILLVIILIIRYLILQKRQEEKIFNSPNEIKTIEDVMTYLDSKCQKQSESSVEGYNWDIYVKLNKPLYSSEVSNESFYNDLVGLIAKVLDYSNFRIIDKDKQILISVLCDIDNKKIIKVYINGESNYFGKSESKDNSKIFEQEKLTDLQIQSPELIQVINSKWIGNLINFGIKKNTYLKYDVYENGIETRIVDRRIFNIIFTTDYQNNVINGIKVGTDYEDIKDILGEPTYYSEEIGLVGYKNQHIYIFFSPDEISIYPVEEDDYNKKEFADLVEKFISSKDAKTFVNSITDIWEDYDLFDYDSKYIDLRYSLRGVKIQFNITSNHGVILSNNYVGQVTKDYTINELRTLTEMPKYIYFENNNTVFEYELERYSNKLGYLETLYINEEPTD